MDRSFVRRYVFAAALCALAAPTLVACGGCPRGNQRTLTEAERQQVADQGPTSHETPEHDLSIDSDEVVTAAPDQSPPDRITPAMIQAVVRAQIEDVRECYETGLHADATLTGRVVLHMHIGASGNVIGADVAESTLASPTVGECIAEHADDWHFPEAAHDVSVRYPFQLNPENAGTAATGATTTPPAEGTAAEAPPPS